ncbi:LysR family carnitine catabolism transcriptional activator [Pseudacidovorax intermedius]|uniref:LysR family carnitine catabolism transcriptional activator n=4 Tax=Pseudacidovorax intermedius TaxID=433924 RepID=A0A370FJY0_9BURK|nr:LysR family carnitine catabolism transcriptional activator [Pseudacidovorax intermedius]
MSQSSLSAALGKLERELGARLFDRHTRACRMTDAGAALLPAARRLVADWDHLVADAQDFGRFARGRVAVAAPNAQCALLLPPVIRAFGESHPGVRVVLHDVPEHEVHALVRSGAADLGIATQTDARTDLVASPLQSDEFVAVMAPDHPLAARRALEWSQLARSPVIGYLPGNPVRTLLEEKLAARGIALDYAFEIALPWTMMGLAREGLGVAVVTMALRPLAVWHGLEVRTVGRPQVARMLTLLRAPAHSPSPAVAAFREQLMAATGARL